MLGYDDADGAIDDDGFMLGDVVGEVLGAIDGGEDGLTVGMA